MPLLTPTLYPTHPAKAQKVLDVLLTGVNQSVATTLRDPDDGEAGWTILDIVCHLRDFEQLWQRRVTRVLNEENPRFDPFDPNALVIQNDYANQDFAAVWAERTALRARLDRNARRHEGRPMGSLRHPRSLWPDHHRRAQGPASNARSRSRRADHTDFGNVSCEEA